MKGFKLVDFTLPTVRLINSRNLTNSTFSSSLFSLLQMIPNKVVDKYILLNILGSGQFGDVYKAQMMDTNKFFAIKTISLDKYINIPRLNEMTRNELDILSKIRNPNIIKFIEMLKTVNNVYIVYELCNGGTLEEYVNKKKYLQEKEALDIFSQILNACKSLVQYNIMHRDFKPSNILFHNGVIKVADFGFCKPLASSFEVTETMVGSPIYMAPEILKGRPYSSKADIYSLGVMLYEMLYSVAPFEELDIPGLLRKIDEGKLVFHDYNRISPSTEYILRRMLEPNESKRTGWEELFDHFAAHSSVATEEKPAAPKVGSEDVHSRGRVPEEGTSRTEANRNQYGQQAEEKNAEVIVARFIKESKKLRDKMVFLWRTFNQGCENIINDESHIINCLTLKKLNKYSQELQHLLQNKQGVLSQQEFRTLKTHDDYGKLFSILDTETSGFDDVFAIYKNYAQSVLDKKGTGNLDSNSDIDSFSNFDQEAYKKSVLSYAENLKDLVDTDFKNDQSVAGRLGLFMNLLLDSIIIDDIYDNFFDISTPFNNQSYLQNLFHMTRNDLSHFADQKMKHIVAH